MRISDVTWLEWAAITLYALTACLVLLISELGRRFGTPMAAVAAIGTVTAANGLLVLSYAGEPAVAYERPGPIKRKGGGERGYFEFEQEGGGGAAATGAGGGAGGGAANGSDGPVAALSSAFSGGDRRAHDALARGLNTCSVCPELVVVRPGFFRMGASPDDQDAQPNEHPGRMVGLGGPFAIGRYEVTVGEYQHFVRATGYRAPGCSGPDRAYQDLRAPVTCVSHGDAVAYAGWLKAITGLPFRLPSEAEWEYAARAGMAGPRSGLVPLAENGDGQPAPAGSGPANAFGLHDVEGNVAELVADCFAAAPASLPGDGAAYLVATACPMRTLRDGHAGEARQLRRLSARRPIEASARREGVGFRIARDLR